MSSCWVHTPYPPHIKQKQIHETTRTATLSTKGKPTHQQDINNITIAVIEKLHYEKDIHFINKTLIQLIVIYFKYTGLSTRACSSLHSSKLCRHSYWQRHKKVPALWTRAAFSFSSTPQLPPPPHQPIAAVRYWAQLQPADTVSSHQISCRSSLINPMGTVTSTDISSLCTVKLFI